MIPVVYVEEAVREHPRTAELLSRLPRATVIGCERWGEVFNPRGQSFRLQKRAPAVVLARKHGERVLPTPAGYGLGAARNFYFSHLLNCPYDCRYCFLQGMFRSAHYVLFVNYEDFLDEIDATAAAGGDQPTWFFSGYDCDSLALDGVSGFVGAFLPRFERRPGAWLELRTKSTRIRPLLERRPAERVVVAFSLTPEPVARRWEHGAPSVERRIAAMASLQRRGWRIGLRFDPVLAYPGYRRDYRTLVERLFAALEAERVHSVSVGPFRMPRAFHRRLAALYPEEPLFAEETVEEEGGVVMRAADADGEGVETVRSVLRDYVPEDRFFACSP